MCRMLPLPDLNGLVLRQSLSDSWGRGVRRA